jgi:OmcA/MtrC family decaheme c-type cytochrome
MNTPKRFSLAALLAATFLMLSSCGGDDVEPPPPEPVTPAEAPVPVPTGTSPIKITANTSPETFAAMKLKVNVGRVTIASAPVVHFSITDLDDNGVIGFGSTSKSSSATVAQYPNLAFALAKLVPAQNGAPSYWVNYVVTTVPSTTSAAAPTRPSTDNTGTLVDNKNGTYSYTFYRDITKIKDQVAAMTVSGSNNKADLGDLTYEPSLVHRLTIQVSGSAPGTGSNTANGVETKPSVPMTNPIDVIYDFVPATGAPAAASDPGRDIVATAKCNECHRQLGGIPGDSEASSGAGFHGGNRNETRYCVVCHTDQRRYGRTEAKLDPATLAFSGSTYLVDGRAQGNMPNNIHKIHMGQYLSKKSYDYAGVKYNETLFPQDIRNCTKCHDASDKSTAKTAQGDNWKSAPSRLACGACHDGIDFATGKGVTIAEATAGQTTGTGHRGGAQAGDGSCSGCHSPGGIDTAHLPVTPPNPNNGLAVTGGSTSVNSAWIASNLNRLPVGAIKVSHEIKSVSLNASGQPVMVFRMLQNGARKDFNPRPAAGTDLSKAEMWDGFFGAPSVQYVFSVPQDTTTGTLVRTDFNASASSYLRSIWNGTATGTSAGTLTGPDGDGFYTVTLTGIKIAANAAMLTGGLGFSYNISSTPPLTQMGLSAYPATPATATGLNPAMPNLKGGLIVITPTAQKVAKKADGTDFSPRRTIVEDARCNACHQELGTFTYDGFHGGQRNDATTCSWCHNPNRTSSGWSADSTSFIHAIHAGAKRSVPYNWHSASATENFSKVKFPGILAQCETCHIPGSYDFRNSASADALPGKQFRTVASGTVKEDDSRSPYAPAGSYGSGFSYSTSSGTATDAAPTTLVTSPVATACGSCHDTQQATAHMTSNGASLYASRDSGALGLLEQCLVCHGPGRVADIKAMHNK